MLDDRQSQTDAVGRALVLVGTAVEPFEDTGQIGLRHALAMIDDTHHGVLPVRRQGDGDADRPAWV